jgi:putative transposase
MPLPHLTAFAQYPLVFVTVCTIRRSPLLANDLAHNTLVKIWRQSATRNGWFVGRYVLMPDHVHFFAMPAGASDMLVDWVGLWKSLSSRVINRHCGQTGPVWQRDHFDRFLRSADSYSAKWEYVRENPVRAGLVKQAEQWPYQGVIHDLAF